MKLLFMYHFLINAANKVVAVHSIQWGNIYPLQEAPFHRLGPFT